MAIMVAAAGMDPLRFLSEEDPLRRNSMMEIARGFADLDEKRREDLARRIIGRLAESMK